MTETGAIVVGILYPPTWYGSESGFAAEVAALEAMDPRVEVAIATYVEPHEVRTARGAGTESIETSEPIEAQPIDPDDRATLGRIRVAVAIDLPPEVATVAPKLEWVQAVGAGTAHLQASGLAEAGIRLTSNGGSNSVAIAEFVFGRLIESRKRFRELAALQVEHRWEPQYGQQLSGQTLGLIGFGAINQAVAHRAAAFGMRILVLRRSTGAPLEDHIERVFGPDQLHEMLGQCDAVIAAVPETPETAAMMDAPAFASMRPGVFFANVGRGTLVDEGAFVEALRSGQIGSAAIDVAVTEPLPADDALWDAPNLQISAHCSTAPAAMFPNLHQIVRDNLRRFIDGEPLVNEVSADRAY